MVARLALICLHEEVGASGESASPGMPFGNWLTVTAWIGAVREAGTMIAGRLPHRTPRSSARWDRDARVIATKAWDNRAGRRR